MRWDEIVVIGVFTIFGVDTLMQRFDAWRDRHDDRVKWEARVDALLDEEDE